MKIINYIKRIISNKDARILFSNFIWLSLLKVVGFLLPLVTLPYLSRVIGLDNFGKIAFAASVVYFFELFTDFGFNYTATRDVAKNRNDIEKVTLIFSNVFWAKTVLMILSLILLVIIICCSSECRTYGLLLFFTFLYIPGHIIFPDWFFQAMEDMKYITILNVISKLFFTMMIFMVINNPSDYIYQPLLIAGGYVISGILSLFFIRYRYGIALRKTNFCEVYNTIKNSFNMFICQFVPSLYSNLSVIFLQKFWGPSASGIFSSGKKFPDVASQISALISRVFYPYLIRRIDRHKFFVWVNLLVSMFLCIVLFLSSNLLVEVFYTTEFMAASKVIKVFAISLPFSFFETSWGNNYLVVVGKEHLLRNNIFVGSVLGVLLSIFLIKNYGYIGAAYTFLLTRIYFALTNWGLSYCLMKKIIK